MPDVVEVEVAAPIGSSDHSALRISLTLQQTVPQPTIRCEVLLKSRVDWDAVRADVSAVSWNVVLGGPDPDVEVNRKLLDVVHRRVPKVALTVRSSDKPWFTPECRRAYDRKQTSHCAWTRHRTRDRFEFFVQQRREAEVMYSKAERAHWSRMCQELAGVSQPHKWWSTLKGPIFGMDSSIPPLLSQDGSLLFNPRDKAQRLLSVFDGKQCRDDIGLPPTCHLEPGMVGIAFRSREVKRLLLDLNSYGGVDQTYFPSS